MNDSEKAPPSETQVFRDQFQKMDGEFLAALPPHLPVEKFMRVVLTAVNASPDLLRADRRSLFESAMKAAQDGLLPDGRDGALVIFSARIKGTERWMKKVQWMPMIAGVLKKVRNSGELASVDTQLVHRNDRFAYRPGLDEAPAHEPDWFGERGDVVGVYAVATLRDGSRLTEIMSRRQIEAVRAVSRAANDGPWTQWWGEMARKTVLRRLSKRLPMSSGLDDLIRRDDELYDFRESGEPARLFRPVANPLCDEAPPEEPAEAGPDALTARARSTALEGRRRFDAWYAALSKEAQERLALVMPSLLKATRDVDRPGPRRARRQAEFEPLAEYDPTEGNGHDG